jgi:hypothetical protein
LRPVKFDTLHGIHRIWTWHIFFTLALAFGVQRVDAQTTDSEPLAEVNGERVTTEELNRALGAKLSKLYEQIYTIKRRELDSSIAQRLLAQESIKRQVSVTALLQAEVTVSWDSYGKGN